MATKKSKWSLLEKGIVLLGISILVSIAGVSLQKAINVLTRLSIMEVEMKNVKEDVIEIKGALKNAIKEKTPVRDSNSLDTPLMLFGSGSTYNFFTIKYPDMLNSYITIFSGPSKTAINMMIRSKFHNSTNISCIGMSATFIPENDLMSESDWVDFKKGDFNRRIVALRIAENPLQVGIFRPDAKCFKALNNDNVTASDLLSLIMNCDTSEYHIYSTSPQSGTRTEYIDLLKKEDSSFTDLPKFVNEFDLFLTTWNTVVSKNKPSIFLGSRYYSYGNIKQLKVIDSDKKEVVKSLYLYFVVSSLDSIQNSTYTISGKKGEFLSELQYRIKKTDSSKGKFYVHVPDKTNDKLITIDLLK